MKKYVIVLMMGVYCMSNAQTADQEKFIELYKENYLEWISSPEIKLMQERDPELRSVIDRIPLEQTRAFQEALAKTKEDRAKGLGFADILGSGAKDMSMDIIKEFFAKENTDVIINLYWDVIRSAETQEIIDLIMPHVLKAKEDFERAGVDIANASKI